MELTDTLRRAAAVGDSNRVTDELRAQGVDKLHFDLDKNGEFLITPVGLYSGGGRSPRLTVQGRVRVLSSPSGNPRIGITVGLTRGSWIGAFLGPTVLLALSVVNLVRDWPSLGSFYFLFGGAGVFVGIQLINARALVTRAWPGLEAMASRIARGSFYVPAA